MTFSSRVGSTILAAIAAIVLQITGPLAWSADSPVVEQGALLKPAEYDVKLYEKKSHEGAKVIVFATDKSTGKVGIAFLESPGSGNGGMACQHPLELGGKLECTTQNADGLVETLTVAPIPSKFCESRHDTFDKKGFKGKANPVMEPKDCRTYYGSDDACICYQIEHWKKDSVKGQGAAATLGPPSDGTGSGGH